MTTAEANRPGVFNAQARGIKNKAHYVNNKGVTAANDSCDTPINMQRISDCGRKVREAAPEVAQHFESLSPAKKQNFMYMAQIGGGLAMALGGAFALAGATAPVLAGGMMLSGVLNSTRSSGQYMLRRRSAGDGNSDKKTEMVNSGLSALTNAPNLSLPGVTAVSSYVLRVMNKARQIEDDGDKGRSDDNKGKDLGHSNGHKLNEARKDDNGVARAFNHAAADTSRALDRLLGRDRHGNRRVDQLPGLGMIGRGVLQTAEGIGIAMLNPVAGVFIAGAGIIYTGAASLMRSADTAANDNAASRAQQPRSPQPEPLQKDRARHRHNGPDFTCKPS